MLIPKVLLVNDDPASLLALESLLLEAAARQEYELLSAGSGKEALRQVLRHDFAVILLDVGMPGMDGFETAEAIHSHPRSYAVPIIFITAHYADEIDRLRAYQAGAADYLFTPIIPQVLQTKVAVFVEMAKKTILLESKTAQLAKLNQDLRVQRLQDLERINAELEQEVAERKLAEQRASELAIRDPLTGLVNRRSLIQQLEHAVSLADRQRGEFALLFLDLDKFKDVNDSCGHEVGDELLRQVAARLVAAVRASDVVARLGGDEFVVLVEGRVAAANAARVARKIVQAHSRPYAIGRRQVRTSSSIGIALYPQDGASAQLIMKHADLAMYHAKQLQRGGVSYFHEAFNTREAEREQWRKELRAALDDGQLELRYQPIVDIAGGGVDAVEALLHWHHPRLGLLAARAWQAQVPDLGLLDRFDEWSVAAACEQAAQWRAQTPPWSVPRICVNLMGAQLRPELAHQLLGRLKRHGLAPDSLGVELPETLLCGAAAHSDAVLGLLRGAGVRLSVDHFGSAGAALAVCKTLPLDELKIDAGFIAAVGDGGGGTDMVAAIVLLARALSLDTVALGVDHAAQLAQLAALGCRRYQGALAGAPLSAAVLQQKWQEADRQTAA
ncbi:putative bifunctional diguanylate cyclase/phosphodiesterase [Janthinobacterium fluminis]|uniref:EAL domain-containing protein n=1 Tax=Janthinobacterium fluminis TaxID=2987524 RepID=A0ABT5JV02_9BURK|nr:EAL domain-containing protein [Janthinobacterium fluminis]MDC8756404.1 EAL domain-containing protein [Janthinobacterium fluminis]